MQFDSGTLAITGVATLAAGSANNITLDDAANNFSTVAITNGNNVTLVDAGALILGASTISGTLGVTTAGAITDSGTLAVTGAATFAAGTGNSITLDDLSNNFSSVTVNSSFNATFRDANAFTLNASTITGSLFITAAGAVDLGTSTIGSSSPLTNLTISTSGAITQSGALTVTGATSLTAGSTNNITFDNVSNNFERLGISSGNNVSIRDANALALTTSTVSGTLDVTTAGAITQSGLSPILDVTGAATFAAGSGNNITLDGSSNTFSSVGITSGNNVTLNDADALILAASTISGTLDVTTAGAITDSGVLAVTGAATFAAGSANNITLDAANNFSTVGITSGNNVNLVDAGALDLAASTISGTLTVATSGAITDTGALSVTGTTTLAAGSANNITLDHASNNFSTVGITSGNNVNLVDAGALDLAASTISGTLTVATSGAITDTGALSVTGTTTLAAGSANNITLDHASNNFSTVGITSGNNITLVDAGALALDASTIAGNLTLNTTGTITVSGALILSGTSKTVTFTSSNNAITFDSTLNGAINLDLVPGTSNIVLNANLGNSTALQAITIANANNITNSATITAQTFTQSAGTGTTALGDASLHTTGATSITTDNVTGTVEVGSLSIGTNAASLSGTVNGLSGQSGADEIVLLNTIISGTHFFDGIDLYPSPTPTPSASSSSTSSTASTTSSVNPAFIFANFTITNYHNENENNELCEDTPEKCNGEKK